MVLASVCGYARDFGGGHEHERNLPRFLLVVAGHFTQLEATAWEPGLPPAPTTTIALPGPRSPFWPRIRKPMVLGEATPMSFTGLRARWRWASGLPALARPWSWLYLSGDPTILGEATAMSGNGTGTPGGARLAFAPGVAWRSWPWFRLWFPGKPVILGEATPMSCVGFRARWRLIGSRSRWRLAFMTMVLA